MNLAACASRPWGWQSIQVEQTNQGNTNVANLALNRTSREMKVEVCHLSREPAENHSVTELNAVGQWRQVENNMVRVKAALDSGALDPVAPPTMAPGVAIKDSNGSRTGQHYGSASGHRIPNLGEQHITGVVPSGAERAMTFQVAEVTRPLLSVGRICDKGNVVTFGSSGGVIVDLVTGEETPFLRDGDGMYQLEFWMPATGFQRPGR